MTAKPIPGLATMPTLDAARATRLAALNAHGNRSVHIECKGYPSAREMAVLSTETAEALDAWADGFGTDDDDTLRTELLQVAALALSLADRYAPDDAPRWWQQPEPAKGDDLEALTTDRDHYRDTAQALRADRDSWRNAAHDLRDMLDTIREAVPTADATTLADDPKPTPDEAATWHTKHTRMNVDDTIPEGADEPTPDALPAGSIIRDRDADLWERTDTGWGNGHRVCPWDGNGIVHPANYLPATVERVGN